MKANSMEATCVEMTTRWRFIRSATMPPTGAIRNTGNWLANPTPPSRREDPVSRYTSQDCATVCIHVPVREINCPEKNN